MSKLSKFKRGLNADQAAALLSSLIDEPVAASDIWDFFYDGFLDGFIECNAMVVRTEPMLDAETHQRQLEQGRYVMTAKEDIEVCWGAHLPCMTVQVDKHQSVTAISDKDGNIYALRDILTNQYLNFEDDDSTPTEQLFEPSDIYAIAEKANSKESVTAFFEIKKNRWCAMSGEYFNFPKDNASAAPSSITRAFTPEPPSRLMALAAVIEIALSERKKHTQSSLINAIADKYEGVRGLSESGLQKLFAEANASLSRIRSE
jgi:hypothetical protein